LWDSRILREYAVFWHFFEAMDSSDRIHNSICFKGIAGQSEIRRKLCCLGPLFGGKIGQRGKRFAFKSTGKICEFDMFKNEAFDRDRK